MYCHSNITVIAHPKTASKSLAQVLIDRGWQKVGHHHDMGQPTGSVVSVIREPKDWYVSWYFHCGRPEPFHGWLKGFILSNDWSKKGFFGVPFTTHLIFFDRLSEGLNAAFADLQERPVELPTLNHLGRNNQPADDFFDDHAAQLLDKNRVDEYSSLKKRLGDESYLRLKMP